ncbi:TetR/AcrR family transcriptional regulator [Mucilaginibacter flavus]|uniref:TetR/AcrR family transcriptional regulator n=1 Tax=Mucilaginibacter flavus TaxID=931504 RepID=UPI0025B3E6F7|nr:TetR/AcrR family transcriptional regulator [Mucilaginibacter flavus]MDN3584834.1 TetR/AcrR family transcriptional regulator [Mucilaginibacter flavus]
MGKAANTRLTILQKSFDLIYVNGYQATSIDVIIATTQVTKGAFYYHFKNKDDMGMAVVNEVMYPAMTEVLIKPLINSADPVNDIYKMVHGLLLDNPHMQVKYGCPVNNLTQEMSPINEAFSQVLTRLVNECNEAIMQSVENGKKAGSIRANVDAWQVAYFVMSGYWGIRNFGKLFNSADCYHTFLKELHSYLQGLK